MTIGHAIAGAEKHEARHMPVEKVMLVKGVLREGKQLRRRVRYLYW